MKKSFKPGTLLCPVPAVMVTCGSGDNKNIITIAWTGIINSDPPITYVSVRKTRHSHDLISESGEFVINLVTENLLKAADYCGVKSGKNIDKFKETGLTAVPSKYLKCPLIAESPLNLECRVMEIREYPTHDMFIAEIVNIDVNEEIIDEKGKIDIASANLSAYIHGEYFGIKKMPFGRFGFSVMKPKTRKKINKIEHEKRVAIKRRKRENAK